MDVMNGKRIRMTITHVFALFAVSHGKWVLPIPLFFCFVFSVIQNGDNQMKISGTINDQNRTKHHRQNITCFGTGMMSFQKFLPIFKRLLFNENIQKTSKKGQNVCWWPWRKYLTSCWFISLNGVGLSLRKRWKCHIFARLILSLIGVRFFRSDKKTIFLWPIIAFWLNYRRILSSWNIGTQVKRTSQSIRLLYRSTKQFRKQSHYFVIIWNRMVFLKCDIDLFWWRLKWRAFQPLFYCFGLFLLSPCLLLYI